jgi:hypothetical protein
MALYLAITFYISVVTGKEERKARNTRSLITLYAEI